VASGGGAPVAKHRDADHTDGFPYTSPVGSLAGGVSPCGALDMAGNVWEWCSEPVQGGHRIRGGAWDCAAAACRSDGYAWVWSGAASIIGFRPVLRVP
jgi:formylglycine-generating enzyme required for sulfatase activity